MPITEHSTTDQVKAWLRTFKNGKFQNLAERNAFDGEDILALTKEDCKEWCFRFDKELGNELGVALYNVLQKFKPAGTLSVFPTSVSSFSVCCLVA